MGDGYGDVRVGPVGGRRRWFCVVLLFSILALADSAFRWMALVSGHTSAYDLAERLREQRYVLEAQNPYDVLFTREERAGRHPATSNFRHVDVDKRIGGLYSIGYPPWTYFTGIFLHSLPPPWGLVQFALANLIALVAIVWWVADQTPPALPALQRLFLPLSVLATVPFWFTLEVGQYGILLIAMVTWSISLAEAGWGLPAGILIGMAMLKPSFTLPFVLLLLYRRQWRALIVCLTYVLAGGLLVCWFTHTAPGTFLSQTAAGSAQGVLQPAGFIKAVVLLGVPFALALPGLMAAFLIATAWWLIVMRERAGMLDRFAFAGLAARLFTYHRNYDDLLLVFLLLALAVRWMNRPARVLLLAALGVGLTLWVPFYFPWTWPFEATKVLCWVFGAAVLARDVLASPVAAQPSRQSVGIAAASAC